MSTTIDQKVVEMRFDNKQFESGVATTMSTLDKFKQKLHLTGASKGLDEINSTARHMNFSGLSSAVEAVGSKFSALEVIGITALANITNSAVNAGKQLAKSLSVDQITAGWDKFSSKTTSVATLIAQGNDIDTVTSQLDRLNWFTDETSYNFTDMVSNIAKFTASGKGLDESVTAMQGIANWAALSGQNAMTASRAMYQISQAMGAGVMRLEDYKSIQNASMDTEEFRQKCLDAAVSLGTLEDNLDGTYASLRATSDSGLEPFGISQFATKLTDGAWLTSDVMMKVFQDYSSAVSKIYEVTEEKGMLASEVIDEIHTTAEESGISIDEAIKKLGYVDENGNAMFDSFGLKAFEAAQKARTFGDAIDSVKDAVSTGWMNTFEIIFGNAEEATELWTDLANSLWDVFAAGGEARNELLQEWKDLGGRDDLIETFWNTWEGVAEIVGPIKEAFRDIFPPLTAEKLAGFTKGLKELTEKFTISEKTANNIKQTFKGLFSILDIGIEVIKSVGKGAITLLKNFSGLIPSVLDFTASMGEGIEGFRNYIKENNLFGIAVEKATGYLTKIISKVKEFGSSLKTEMDGSKFKGFMKFFEGLWNIVKTIGSGLSKAFISISKGVSGVFGEHGIFDAINSGIFSGILVGVYKFIKKFTDTVDGVGGIFEGVGGIFENVKNILDDVRGCFKAYQDQLKANTLFKIASAIGLLTASIFVLSTIDPESLGNALVALTALFAELFGSLSVLEKMGPTLKGLKGTIKSISLMIGMSLAILILSGALKRMASVDMAGIVKGLFAIGVLMGELSLFLRFAKFDKKMKSTAIGIVILSSAMLILAKAVKNFGALSWSEIGKGLASIGALLLELAIFTKITGSAKHMASVGLGLLLLSASMKIFASVIKDFGNMQWEEIGKGLVAMGGALAEVAIAMRIMPKNAISIGLGLIAVGAALKIMASVMKDFGNMQWEEIGKGLVAMGGALAELSIALNLMKGTISGSAALLVAALALAILVPVMKSLGSMSWESIAKGLVTLAGAFAVIGVAGLLLKPLIPTILGLAASFALFGISVALIGAGLLAISVGFLTLAAAGTVGATAIVAALNIIIIGILDLIPAIARSIGEGIVELCKVIGDCAPQIVESAFKLIAEIMKSLAEYTPQIVESLMIFLIEVINGLATHMPNLIQAVTNLIGALFSGIFESLNGMDYGNLLSGIIATGLMTGLIYALSGVGPLIPAAMTGILGVGAVIAELAIVLAAIGGLSKIPGFEELIAEGGNFLATIGIALGKFIGGLAGGIAQGFTTSLPQIGEDLASFMTNIQPFIDGAKKIDASVFEGVTALSKAIIALTAADIMNGIAYIITGGSSLSDFAKELVPFGEAMKSYSDSISGLDASAVTASANAANALSELANNLPNSGGLVSLFAGDNSLLSFGLRLIPFGKAMKLYSESISGLDAEAVTASANAAKSLSELANNLPNVGGLVSLFTGDNSLFTFGAELVPFGRAMKSYSESISGLDPDAVVASANAAKSIAELANNLPNTGGLVSWFAGDNSLGEFANYLEPFGKGMKAYADSVEDINPEAVTASANAAKSLSELAANLPNRGGLVSWFTGDNSIAVFGEQLVELGKGMKAYADSVEGINPEAVTASANAAKSIAELANNLPNSGGLVSWFVGENNISTFGDMLEPLGKGMKAYADSVEGINPEAVTASANAAKSLSELAANLPNSGGLVSLFTGENNLSTFGDMLEPLGKGMKAYADSVEGINPEAVTASANAAKSISELANNLPNSGGLASWFVGENSLSIFGAQLAPFGAAMKAYADSVEGINPEAVTASANAAKTLSELANNLPERDESLIAFMTGETGLIAFGNQLAPFGRSIKAYADSVSGIDGESVIASANGAKAMSELVSNLPASTSGLASLFGGESDLESFGNKIVPFGRSIKAYADSVSGIDGESVIASANAAKALYELSNNLPTSGGLLSFFKGDVDIVSTISELVPFGRSMKQYSDVIAGIDSTSITNSANAAKSLMNVFENLSGITAFSGLFGDSGITLIASKLIPLGKGLKGYSDAISGIDSAAISSSSTAASKLVSFVNSTAGVNTAGVGSFVEAINTLGKAQVNKFVEAFSNVPSQMSKVGSDIITSLINSVKSKSSSMTTAAASIMTAFSTGINENKSKANEGITALLENMSKSISAKSSVFRNSGSVIMENLSTGITNKRAVVNNAMTSSILSSISSIRSYYTSFYSAGSYLADGLANGIADHQYKAVSAAIQMAYEAKKAMEAALGIASPSKVFYKIGDFTGQGFVKALEDYGSESYNASYDMADYARKGLSNAISKIQKVIDTDSDYHPTIRPVLDLSDVESGASAIGSLFSNGATIGMSAKVDSISSMMNNRNQNGAQDVVSAIESLRKDLDKVGGTTNNTINGINYNDDAEISNAIQTIVRAAKMERRA